MPGQASGHRYNKIAGDEADMDRLLVEMFLESYAEPPEQTWLDSLHSQPLTRCSSNCLCMCFKYSRPTISWVGFPGQPLSA